MRPPGAGKGSYDLVDHEKLFDELNIESGSVFADLGCGRGDYAVRAAEAVGTAGRVYAIDLWEDSIAELRERASLEGIGIIIPLVADIGAYVPLENCTVDMCLIATALHDLKEIGAAGKALEETHRLLKRGGVLAVVEFKKIEDSVGPPLRIRLSPEELQLLLAPHGFVPVGPLIDLGPHNYLMKFISVICGQ